MRRAVVLIPSFVGSLLRYRLLQDTLKSIALSESVAAPFQLVVLLSFQCCVRFSDTEKAGEEEEAGGGESRKENDLQRTDELLIAEPNTKESATVLDCTPMSAPASVDCLRAIFCDGAVDFRCFQHEPIDEGGFLYGSLKPKSQFEHIRYLAQYVEPDDVVFFSDDDDLSMPRRYSHICALFSANKDLKLVFHQLHRFYSYLAYHSMEHVFCTARCFSSSSSSSCSSHLENNETNKLPEYFQFVVRGNVFSSALESSDLGNFHMQDIRFSERFHLVMNENLEKDRNNNKNRNNNNGQDKDTNERSNNKIVESHVCDEKLLVFRKSAHTRYWKSV